jgi:hypothetical protein
MKRSIKLMVVATVIIGGMCIVFLVQHRRGPESMVFEIDAKDSPAFYAFKFGEEDGQLPRIEGSTWVVAAENNAFALRPDPWSTRFRVVVRDRVTHETVKDHLELGQADGDVKAFWILFTGADGVTWFFVGTRAEFEAIWDGEKNRTIRAVRYVSSIN